MAPATSQSDVIPRARTSAAIVATYFASTDLTHGSYCTEMDFEVGVSPEKKKSKKNEAM